MSTAAGSRFPLLTRLEYLDLLVLICQTQSLIPGCDLELETAEIALIITDLWRENDTEDRVYSKEEAHICYHLASSWSDNHYSWRRVRAACGRHKRVTELFNLIWNKLNYGVPHSKLVATWADLWPEIWTWWNTEPRVGKLVPVIRKSLPLYQLSPKHILAFAIINYSDEEDEEDDWIEE